MDPFLVLTAAAVATKTLKVGTGVCLINQRDPIQTAKLVASLDQLSGGRFLFGVGNGWNKEEMEHHGTNFETRHKLSRERIEAMKAIWSQDTAEYHGEFVNFAPMQTWPKPVQTAVSRSSSAAPSRTARAVRCAMAMAGSPAPAARGHGDIADDVAAVSRDGAGGGARSGFAAGHAVPRRRGSRTTASVSRPRHCARGYQPAGGETGNNLADPGSLGAAHACRHGLRTDPGNAKSCDLLH